MIGGGITGASGVLSVLLELDPDPELALEAGERMARQLRAEIAELDVQKVDLVAGGTAPDGVRGADPITIGAMVVALSASGGVLTTLIETLREWLGRHSARHRISVTIDGDTIELGRASTAVQRELVNAYIRRHCGR